MSLITKTIWVEGPDGQQVERTYWEKDGIEINPYRKKRKVGKLMQKTARGTARDGKGYTWSMGYNNLVGRYSPGGEYSRFGGSSLNRKKKPKDETIPPNQSHLSPGTRNLLGMARKVQSRMSEYGGKLPGPFSNLLLRCDAESKAEFGLWLSEQVGRSIVPMAFGIHMLSARSRGKIKDKATAFFRSCPGDRIFCTLTFIAAVDDATGMAILNKYLTSLRKAFPAIQYLWVAERQENNADFPGNIHFHIILNKRLPVRRWNALWVLQQYNAGLVAKNKFGEWIEREEIDERFHKGTMQKVLNPFDVKRVRSIAGLSMYLTKYITKQKKNVPFGCAVWHCSRRVSRIFTRTTVAPSAFRFMRSLSNYRVDKETGECFPPRGDVKYFYAYVYVENKQVVLPYLREMEQVNKWILQGHQIDRLSMIDDDLYRSKISSSV
jgi:hypothetical protein